MSYPVALNGFERQTIVIEPAKLFSAARLLINGTPAEKGEKRGEYKLRRDDGTEVVAMFKSYLIDPIPNLVIDGSTIQVAQPLQWYEWVMACVPLLLIMFGGAIGGLLGVASSVMNVRILRMSNLTQAVRYLLCGLNIFATLILARMIITALVMMVLQ